MNPMRRLARSLDALSSRVSTVAAKLGRLAALLDAFAETGEAVERKAQRPWPLCRVCGGSLVREGSRLRCMGCERQRGARPS